MRFAKLSALVLTTALALPVLAEDDPVVATVDGEPIRLSALARTQAELPEQYQQMPIEALFDVLRERVVTSALLADEAERRNLADDPDVRDALAEAERVIVRNRLIQTTIEDAVTEDALLAAYGERKAEPGFGKEEVKARHILVESEAEAADLIVQLEDGADFAALAEAHSTGPSGSSGGDLGYFEREQMVGPFADAAFAMAPGEFSETPVETRFGWHVILVEDRRTTIPSFDDTRLDLEQELGRAAVTSLMDELRADATIELFDAEGNQVPAAD